jgi:hypothetical protein
MKIRITILLCLVASVALAQDDLLKELEGAQPEERRYATATFKGTRIVNGMTVETRGRGSLEFIFQHRFGQINQGAYELWGLDEAFTRLGLEYGITDRLGVSIGRTSTDKTFDGYVKYKVLRQQSGGGSPVTITLVETAAYQATPSEEDNPNLEFAHRMSYATSALIARKVNGKFSLQLTPLYIHRNAVEQDYEENDLFVLGAGGRHKITRSVALTMDYFYRINPKESTPYYNSFGLGVDIETGGHVFQIVLSNSQGMIERQYAAETAGDFWEGDIHLGFNVTRTFQLKKQKE